MEYWNMDNDEDINCPVCGAFNSNEDVVTKMIKAGVFCSEYSDFEDYIECGQCGCDFKIVADIYVNFQNKNPLFLNEETRLKILKRELNVQFFKRIGQFLFSKTRIKYLVSKIRELQEKQCSH